MKKYFTLVSFLLLAITAQSQMRYLKGILQGSQEVPPVPSTATGVVIVKYDTVANFLELFGNYQGLTAVATAAHIHGPAAPGVNASVLFSLTHTGGTTGTLKGTATLTATQETQLISGLMYVNVHNATYPGGEIRAQLMPATDGQTEMVNGRLQGAQEVPPNGSTAQGAVIAIIDKSVDSIYLTGNYSGLTTAATASHIHHGIPGVNGPVFQNLTFTNATSGILQVATTITDSNQVLVLNGSTYVNVHNPTYTGGEIRAQLTKLSQMMFFQTTLSGSKEVPPTPSTAMGTVIVRYNSETKKLDLIGDYQNLTAAITGSHIHGPASTLANAPVLFNLNNSAGTSGVLTASVTLSPAQESDLFNNLMYVNVHSSTYPGGEIRGQLMTVMGVTEFLAGNLMGTQEVPPNTSTAVGTVTALVDKTNRNVYLTGYFSGLVAPATAAHIHEAPAGVNGPVIVPLSVTPSTAGTITGSAPVSAGFVDSLVRGFAYVNIHNTSFPGGEIRAQLGDLSLPVRLLYFNGYKTGNSIALVWETTQEINLRHFEIEQQDAATGAWVTQRTVGATGGTYLSKYNVSVVPNTVKDGYVLYRLKMVDIDGKFSYSPVIRINILHSKAGLSIMANPVTGGTLAYTITGLAANEKATVMVADYNGRIVIQTKASTLQNNRLDVSKLAAGMYQLIVSINDVRLQESFSKQ